MYKIIRLILVLALITSCNEKKEECICTFEYAPVCANGILFDNECLAKCNGVSEFAENEVCAQLPMPACPEGLLCAQMMPPPKLYKNECEAKIDKAVIIERKFCD